jgi:flagellar basal body rod protein FlgG
MAGLIAPLNGLLNFEAQFNQSANNIARASLPASSGVQDSVDLSTAAVSLMQSRNSFEANTKVIQVVDEMDKTLVNSAG